VKTGAFPTVSAGSSRGTREIELCARARACETESFESHQ